MLKKLMRGWYSLPTILVFQMMKVYPNPKGRSRLNASQGYANSRGVYYHRGQNGDIKSFTFTLFIPISVCVCQGIGFTTYSYFIISTSENVMSSSASAGLGLLDLSAPVAATSAPPGVSSNAAGLLQADTTDATGKNNDTCYSDYTTTKSVLFLRLV